HGHTPGRRGAVAARPRSGPRGAPRGRSTPRSSGPLSAGAAPPPARSRSPSVRWLRGRALEEVGRRDEADPLMGDPAQVFSSYGPWWATRGRWARIRGEE